MRKINKKKVGMFVWNYFTNDARVLRECTALTEAGYEVDLIAIHNPNIKDLKRFEEVNGFNVIRVKRYPSYLTLLRKSKTFLKNNKLAIIPILILYILALIFFTKTSLITTAILVLLYGIISIKKVSSFLIRSSILLNMIYYGLKKKYDIYHSNDLNTLPQGYICSRLRRAKLLYDSHEVQTSRTGYTKRAYYIEKFFINKIDGMIMTTKTRADYVADLYKIRTPYIIHNYPFNTGDESIKNKYDVHKILNIPKEEPILLYQGGIQVGRGLDKIVDAVPMFKRGITVFIGDGKIKEELKAKVKEKGIEHKVRFLNKVPVNELMYYTADAYLGFQVLNNVCFNHYSALSNKLFEYIMSEIPVVACDFPEIKRIVEGEEAGICIDSHNPDEIAKAVNKMLDDEELHNKFKRNCKYIKTKYNWDNEKKNFVNIYENILS